MDKKLFIELQQELLTQQRLERAAPDLLDALKALIGEFNVCLQADDRMCVGCGCLQLQRRGEPYSRKHLPGCKLGQAETAVAKAEGRA